VKAEADGRWQAQQAKKKYTWLSQVYTGHRRNIYENTQDIEEVYRLYIIYTYINIQEASPVPPINTPLGP